MRKLTALLLGLVVAVGFGTVVMADDGEGDWKAQKVAFDAYVAQKATAKTASDWAALADTDHAKRPEMGFVRAWMLERAAKAALDAGDNEPAGKYAHAVLEQEGAQSKCLACAWTIIGFIRSEKHDWQRASDAYRTAQMADPENEAAKQGEKNLRDAKKWKDSTPQ